MLSRTELETFTVKELREIAMERGITGMSKKRKDVIIDAILENQGNNDTSEMESSTQKMPTGVEFNAVSKVTNPDGKKGDTTQTFCRISSGATSQQFDVAGYTVSSVMEFMCEVLNIEKTSSPIVNGEKVTADYVIKPGDNIEFVKEAGSKG